MARWSAAVSLIQAIDGAGPAAVDVVRALLAVSAAAETTPQPDAAPADPAHPDARVDLPPDPVTATGRTTLAELAADMQVGRLAVGDGQPQVAPSNADAAASIAARSAAPTPSPVAAQPAPASTADAQRANSLNAQLGAAAAQSTAASMAATALSPGDAAPPAGRVQPHADGTPIQRPADAVVLPVSVTQLHSAATGLQRPPHLPTPGRAARQARERAPNDDDSSRARDDETSEPPSDDIALAPAPDDDGAPDADVAQHTTDPGYRELSTMLFAAGQHAALRELDLNRRVLLIVPGAAAAGTGAPARVHLMGLNAQQRGQVQSFRAQWWPSSAGVWSQWRLHRDGELGGAPRLCSRAQAPRPAGAVPCLLRLGPQPASLIDPGSACLDVADLQRFRLTLGGQWSVLALLCPSTPAAR
jgi:hypothetical protein